MNTQIKTWIGLAVVIIAALLAGFFVWYSQKNYVINYVPVSPPEKIQRACTEEAKICPDGSAVGRTGLNCEFASCPEIVGIADKIIISAPAKNSTIFSPIIVSGKARGTWFFEGSFPMEVYEDSGKKIGSGTAQFVSSPEAPEWMTENFVNFSGTVEFSKPTTETGYILFKKDNSSDLRELDESFKLPVKFYASSQTDDSPAWRAYSNKNLGFSLGFPESWKGYVATESSFPNDKSVSFSFKDGHQPFSLFTIRIYTSSEWANTSNKSALEKITEDEGKVFVCDGCCGKGPTDGGGQFDKFQQDRCKEGGKILETFQLNIND
ncbi:MAG: Gmad2 immunoglobulin-like domain-containing protein [Parcubacteria group bacterium]|jgi:hypothetical protein